MPSQPGSSNLQSKMPAYTPTLNWQPPTPSRPGDAGLCDPVQVGEFSPPYYISQLGDSLIISGSFNFGNFRIIYAWALEVEGGFVSS
ncbi:hypothetical protein Tco_0258587 [Tanacetum coccineum]